jgi:hypothetical protein
MRCLVGDYRFSGKDSDDSRRRERPRGAHVTGLGSGRSRRWGGYSCEICVGGHLGETTRYAFPALSARMRGSDTVLASALTDNAAFYGGTGTHRMLGSELIEVRRLSPS